MNQMMPIKESWVYETGHTIYKTMSIERYFKDDSWNICFEQDSFCENLRFDYSKGTWSVKNRRCYSKAYLNDVKMIINDIKKLSNLNDITRILYTEDEKKVFRSFEELLKSV